MKVINREILVVNDSEQGLRVDVFLTQRLAIKRVLVQKNIQHNKVIINSKKAVKSTLLNTNDQVELIDFIVEEDELNYVPINKEIEIIYEDEWIIVANKPRGMIVNYGIKNTNQEILINVVYHNLLKKNNNAIPPFLVHRIDKETSGLVILAKTELAHEKMQQLFKKRLVVKNYLGITYGKFLKLKGRIEVKLIKNSKNPRIIIPSASGKEAITIYEVLKQNDELSLCKFDIITGRTHQIRVHMKFLNHPLIGDQLYGNNKYNKDGMFLHASSIKFIHPFTNKEISLYANLPQEFNKMLKKHHLEII